MSGPGRIDIVDGQTRYEVSRSLIDHRDLVIRNDDIWFGVFPGRGGQRYTSYRFPQSVLGAAAVALADLTGPAAEGRRHFFFVLTSAAAAGLLAVLYAAWFRRRGLTETGALLWAAAGIFCTPSWFYGTSSFDDILGAVAVVAALVAARNRDRPSSLSALQAGLLVGLAFNCKQPLAAFGLATLAAADRPEWPWRLRLGLAARVVAGAAVGIAAYFAYERHKFPPGSTAGHASLLAQYIPVWPGHPITALLALAISPGAGAIWYCPTLVLGWAGLWRSRLNERALIAALLGSIAVVLGFFASMSIFKGDPAWGPRYLTPAFAVVWLFAPEGAARWGRKAAAALLASGLAVQLLALTVDPHRLYVERGLPSAFGAVAPVLYFYPPVAHLVNRPREIFEVWRARSEPGDEYSPSRVPTAAIPILDEFERGPAALKRYKMLNSFRPWWVSQRYLSVESRPVPIVRTVLLELGGALSGAILILLATRKRPLRADCQGSSV